MSDQIIPLEKTETYQRTNCSFAPVGPGTMMTPRGEVYIEDVPGFLSMEIMRDGKVQSVGILVYEPKPGKGEGMLVQFSADNARAVAASLMMIADKIEAMEPNA